MPWYLALLTLLSLIIFCMAIGMPIAMAFLMTNIVGVMIFMGGVQGLIQIAENSTALITSFALAPVPLFILMGALFFHTGLARRVFDALDKLLGSLPGRLAYLTVTGGTLFSTLTGNTLANTAMLGALLSPEMQRRGYNRALSLGPIVGTGGLAMIIPPSGLAVLLGSIAQIDIGKLLIAGFLPGMILAGMFVVLIALQVRFDPTAAPSYDIPAVSLREKLYAFVVNILPMSLVVVMVIGFILMGIATPSESAAFGALGVIILAIAFRQLTWHSIRTSIVATLRVTCMVFFIIMGSSAYSNLLAFSGASAGLLNWATAFDLNPVVLLLIMFAVLLFLGTFMDQVSMMLITVPIFFPLSAKLGFDPIWFGVIVLLALEMSLMTPPFGLLLYVMLGVAPEGTKISHVVQAAIPYLVCDIILVGLLILFPSIALYLPALMK
ncbi:MAG: TRAP transporter large permease subunit [Beijerinckiaceae bacterium]